MLDLFQDDISAADQRANRSLATELPATFGDTFQSAVSESFLFGQSTAGINSRIAAASDYAREIEQQTGDRSLQPLLATGGLDAMNKRIAQLSADHPDLKPLDDEELDKRAVARSKTARQDAVAMGARERTAGGTAGAFLGGAVGAATDPINMLTFPLAAPEGLGVLATAGIWGAIGMNTQAAVELAGAPYRERVDPGYSDSGEPIRNILMAGAGAAVIGGGLKGAANAWTRVKTGQWPRTIRDAGNVVESEAQVAQSNPFPGVDGEVAHREAMSKTIDDLLADRPVNVGSIITPEMEAARRPLDGEVRPPRSPSDIVADPSFREWFQGSKVADASGEPIPVFHGTSLRPNEPEFNKFDAAKLGQATEAPSAREAYFFSEDHDLARSYAESTSVYDEFAPIRLLNQATFGLYEKFNEKILQVFNTSAKREGKIVTAHLAVQNPLIVDMGGKEVRDESFHSIIMRAKEAGHDGVLFQNAIDPGFVEGMGEKPANVWAVFKPDQIKIRSFNPADKAAATAAVVPKESKTVKTTPPSEAVKSLAENSTPEKIVEARSAPETDEAVVNDLNRLRATGKDIQVPMGEVIGADGKPVAQMRSVDSVIEEADSRIKAAAEIKLCALPQEGE